ncbi:MAG: hypothetical protein ACYC3X_30115 [Pirellulaceae bacterium]
MDDPNSGGEKKVRTFTTAKSDAKRQSESWMPPTNRIPPGARPKRAITAEVDQRVEYTIRMLLDGHRKEVIKKFFYTNYGVKARQVERYLRLARARLGRCTLTDVDELRAVQYARLTEIYRNAERSTDKLAALRAINDMCGVNAPQKVAETTVDGKDKDIFRQTVKHLTIEQLRALRDAKKQMERIISGETLGDN